MKLLPLSVPLLLCSCLGPQVSDDVVDSTTIRPPGTEIPDIDDSPSLAARIADNDNVDGLIPRISGFAEGGRIWYWDMGPAPEHLAPIFVLMQKDAMGVPQPIGHAPIAGVIPGSTGYSPFWSIGTVLVTDAYDGEVLPSLEALEEAISMGLVEEPVIQEGFARNCPVVARDTLLAVGGGNDPVGPNGYLYWRGRKVAYYDFGPMAIESTALASTSRLLRLARTGEPPLSEVIRQVDMTGDGDIEDTNDVFEHLPTTEGYTPVARIVDVTVTAMYGSIDTSGDETMADARATTDLFAPDPTAAVLSFSDTDELKNCPQQRQAGAL